MSKYQRDIDYLQDINGAIGRILDYRAGFTWDEFRQNHLKTQDAVIHNLEVMGEATKSISTELRSKFAEIPWRDMDGTFVT